MQPGVVVVPKDLIAKMDFLIWIKTFQVLSSSAIGTHTNGQPIWKHPKHHRKA